jgi:hypothetical protein
MATEQAPLPLPNLKRFEFLAVMIWVALAGAALILLIDYQIKHSILQASERAWEGISALERQTRGTSAAANSNGNKPSGVPGHDGTSMEMGPLGEANQGGVDQGNATKNGSPKPRTRARPPRIQGTDSLGDGTK